MNKPVSFELAKLLKEKGFKTTAGSCYYNEEFFINQNIIPLKYPELKGEEYKEKVIDKTIFAPTIADVVMWLYEKCNVWIEVYYDNRKKEFYIVWNGEEYKFNSPTEAYIEAIKYCLNNLD